MSFYIFFSILLIIYGAVNYYVFIRGLQSIPLNSLYRKFYISLFLFLALSYIVGRFLEKISLPQITDFLIWVGSFWIGAIFYFFLIILLLDLLRIINHLVPIFPSVISGNYLKVKQYLFFVVIASVLGILIYGNLNTLFPKVKNVDITISKSMGGLKSLNIVAVSDIHFGSVVGKQSLEKIVNIINSLDPDIVLLLGDIVDGDITSIINNNEGESLKNIKSKFGVFAITGNHEYICGIDKACQFLKKNGAVILRDTSVLINNMFYILGREDRTIQRFTNRKRKPLKDLMTDVNRNYPIILMDHQPINLEESNDNGIDLQLSGHTHHAQLWPLNYITEAVYEISWGYLKKNNTHIYITCGVGTWGPPIRIGSWPEIVNIKLKGIEK